jgi:hypothetical protein
MSVLRQLRRHLSKPSEHTEGLVGMTVSLRVDGLPGVSVAPTYGSLKRVIDAFARGDDAAKQEELVKAFLVEQGTRARILGQENEITDAIFKVQILRGRWRGRTGFVSMAWMSKQ